MKKIALIAGVVVLAFALAACGGGTSNTTTNTATTNGSNAGADATTVAGNDVVDKMLAQDAAKVQSITVYDATNKEKILTGDSTNMASLVKDLTGATPELVTDISNINIGKAIYSLEINYSDNTVDDLYVLEDNSIVRFVNSDTNVVQTQSSDAVKILNDLFAQ